MPTIGVDQFEPLSFQQANPLLSGMQVGEGLVSGLEDIQKQKLANAVAQAVLPYQGPLAAAQLQKAQVEPDLLRAQTSLTGQQAQFYGPEARARMAEQYATAANLGQEAKFTPLKYAIEAANTQRTASRFGGAYQMAKALQEMPQASRDTWIANNSQAYNDMVSTLANSIGQQTPGSLPGEFINKFIPGYSQPPQQQNTQPTPNIQTPFVSGDIGQQLQSKLASQLEANNRVTTSQMKGRADSAEALESWLQDNQPEYAQRLANISQYAGLLGKGQKFQDMLKEQSPQSYQDYLWFKNVFSTNLNNQIKMMEKMGATDSQREELNNMAKQAIERFDLDPASAINLLNTTLNTMHQISGSVLKSSQPLFPGVREKLLNLKSSSNPYVNLSSQSNQSMARIQGSDGKIYRVPSDRVDELLKDDPDAKRLG